MPFQEIEVVQDGASLKITKSGNPQPEYITLANIQSFEGIALDLRRISDPVFTGAGLDDMTTSGSSTDITVTDTIEYQIEISDADTPDSFRWRKRDRPTVPYTAFTADIPVTGAAQEIENGLFVTFAATTGHTLNDIWTVSLRENAHMLGQTYGYDEMFRVWYKQVDGIDGYFDIQQVTNQAGWTADDAGLAQALSDLNGFLPV